jgi:hypothetical protein
VSDPSNPDAAIYGTDQVPAGPDAIIAGPTFAEWLEANPPLEPPQQDPPDGTMTECEWPAMLHGTGVIAWVGGGLAILGATRRASVVGGAGGDLPEGDFRRVAAVDRCPAGLVGFSSKSKTGLAVATFDSLWKGPSSASRK